MAAPRIVFAGDREIAVDCLRFLTEQGVRPAALLVASPDRATHATTLRELCAHLDERHVLVGDAFRSDEGVELLASLGVDYVIGVHFPYLVPAEVLALPRVGAVNLHPALLPYNRGWHTPSWAILDGTPFGATLHFMDEGVDTGDIVLQRPVEVRPDDTAHTLYQRALAAELEVFREGWPLLASGDPPRSRQTGEGTVHRRGDLKNVQRLDLDDRLPVRDVLGRLRALTTSRVEEAAFFEVDGVRHHVQVALARGVMHQRGEDGE